MLIIDAHLDLSWNALQWNRDLLKSAYTIRTQEQTVQGKGRATGTVAYPELRRGRIFVVVATLFARSTGRAVPYVDYPSPAQAFGVARGQLAYYRGLEKQGHLRILEDTAGLNAHLAEWQAWDGAHQQLTDQTPPLGFVISMEGADPILEPSELEEWADLGLRLLGLTHYGPGRYAGGTGTEVGLTDLGRQILPEMQRTGVILDLTHSSDQSFWESLEIYEGLVIASHNNCRALVPHQRQFSDEQLKAIFAHDGVIGVAMDDWMLHPGWVVGQNTPDQVPLARVVDHIDHICQLAGNTRYAGIGTDLDGGYGREQSPGDLDTISDLQRIPAMLAERGYSESDIVAIMHGNWLRLFNAAWTQRQAATNSKSTVNA
jgi:membrane dipeptidase